MDLYVDSAKASEIDRLLTTGLFAGITCNPGILEKDGVALNELPTLFKTIRAYGKTLDVFFQAWGATSADLLQSSQAILDIDSSIIVKIPATPSGLPAAQTLITSGVQVLLTAAYDASQAVLGVAMGAHSIAPYFGRMNDNNIDALREVATMQNVIVQNNSDLKIIAASLRSPRDIVNLADAGVQGFTAAPTVWDRVFNNELAVQAAADFELNITQIN